MDLVTLAWLRSAEGAALLAELAGRDLAESRRLALLSELRRRYAPELARAAVELALLRRHAQHKFAGAEGMFFVREALEQASAAPVAAWRASRLASCGEVADLGCGIGGDALALASAGALVIAVDRDQLRLALLAANAEALGLRERLRIVQADLLRADPPPAVALFCDPARRVGGRRRFDVQQYDPPLARVLGWRSRTQTLAIKMHPGVDPAELSGAMPYELEFVSLAGELKEAVLWCGAVAAVPRRATVISADGATFTLTGDAEHAAIPQSTPLAWLYEPDPAVFRADLLNCLATQLNAAQIDPQIAYLTAEQQIDTPFARCWRIREWMPFQLKRLRARLRELDVGRVTVKKRGSPLESDQLARQLSGDGNRPLVVVLTRVRGRPAVLIGEAVNN
jgi:SAM-dependent methyltransferase